MNIHQIAVIILCMWACLGIGARLQKGDETKLVAVWTILLFSFLDAALLGIGGFFHTIHWPQIVWFVCNGVGLGGILVSGGKVELNSTAWGSIIMNSIFFFLYYAGGLFDCFKA